MTPLEEWRAVVGYEGAYEVSDQGRVRSLTRTVLAGPSRYRISKGRLLSIYQGGHYSKVRLKVDGAGSTKNVHQLVMQAFVGPPLPGMEVCHNNGQPHDNRLTNLRYGTHSDNQRDQVAHGSNPRAARTRCGNGHEFTAETTRPRGPNESGRRCGVCEDARGKRRWQQELERRDAS